MPAKDSIAATHISQSPRWPLQGFARADSLQLGAATHVHAVTGAGPHSGRQLFMLLCLLCCSSQAFWAWPACRVIVCPASLQCPQGLRHLGWDQRRRCLGWVSRCPRPSRCCRGLWMTAESKNVAMLMSQAFTLLSWAVDDSRAQGCCDADKYYVLRHPGNLLATPEGDLAYLDFGESFPGPRCSSWLCVLVHNTNPPSEDQSAFKNKPEKKN